MQYIPSVVKTVTISAFIGSSFYILISQKFLHKLDYYNEARVFNKNHSLLRNSKNVNEQIAFKKAVQVIQHCPFDSSCTQKYNDFKKSMFQLKKK